MENSGNQSKTQAFPLKVPGYAYAAAKKQSQRAAPVC